MANVPVAQANAQVERAFSSLGLAGRDFFFRGRQYHGTYRGRGLHIYVRAVYYSQPTGGRSVYQGHDLELFLDSPLKTRAALAHAKSMTGWINHRVVGLVNVPVESFASRQFALQALEPAWLLQLVATAGDEMIQIAEQNGERIFSVLQVYPASLHLALRLPWDRITEDRVQAWANQLANLAVAAEQLPPPAQPVEESKRERDLRLDRNKGTRTGLIIAIAFMVLMIAFGLLPLFLFR